MSRKTAYLLAISMIVALLVAVPAALVFVPKNNGVPYRLTVEKGQGFAAVGRQLADKEQVFSRWGVLLAAYLNGTQNQLAPGSYRLPARVSAWEIVRRLSSAGPDMVRIQIVEGMRFANQNTLLRHDTKNWSDKELMQKIASEPVSDNPEGLFFPDTYEVAADSSDVAVYRAAYRAMQENLQAAWESRADNLPYKTPYELLIMASLIEKETAHEEDRRDVAAVFRNRLAMNMRLQTDPAVIYGMGSAYNGKIRRADLQRDTPYNTYTRYGLTPTPIALPGRAALDAAAQPSDSKFLYFVSRMDGTGKSQFSHTLEEHNAAVKQYILKK